MHPQLQSEKRIGLCQVFAHAQVTDILFTVCKDLIQALDMCHASGWRRLTGQCNKAKNELNKCLHAEVASSTCD